MAIILDESGAALLDGRADQHLQAGNARDDPAPFQAADAGRHRLGDIAPACADTPASQPPPPLATPQRIPDAAVVPRRKDIRCLGPAP